MKENQNSKMLIARFIGLPTILSPWLHEQKLKHNIKNGEVNCASIVVKHLP